MGQIYRIDGENEVMQKGLIDLHVDALIRWHVQTMPTEHVSKFPTLSGLGKPTGGHETVDGTLCMRSKVKSSASLSRKLSFSKSRISHGQHSRNFLSGKMSAKRKIHVSLLFEEPLLRQMHAELGAFVWCQG